MHTLKHYFAGHLQVMLPALLTGMPVSCTSGRSKP